MASENGWEPAWVGQDRLVWLTVPGTKVNLQFNNAQPSKIMRAFAADYNAFVEPLRDPDSACYTPTNSVSTSNHLNGTAMDLNWDSHPFHVKNTFNGDQQSVIREMLNFYDGTMYWGGDWNDPIDEMHWQMGYNSFNNPGTDDFINNKLRADGLSTFRRGAMAPVRPPVSPAVLVAAVTDDELTVFIRAMGGSLSRDRYAQLLPAAKKCLADCGCNTVDRIAMWCSQIGHESGGLQWMEEIADGSQYEGRGDLGNTQPGDGQRYKGRGPIQVTGRHNYTVLSQWAFDQGLTPSPTFFVDNPEQLANDQYGFTGVTWYWTTQRALNDASDAKNLELATRMINGGLNGIDDRRNRYNSALAMGQQLLLLSTAVQQVPQPQPQVVQVSMPESAMDRIYREQTQEHPSKSSYRTPGEGVVGSWCTIDRNIDAMMHQFFVEWNAIEFGDPESIYRIFRSAAGRGADNSPAFIAHARAVLKRVPSDSLQQVLTKIEEKQPELIKAFMNNQGV